MAFLFRPTYTALDKKTGQRVTRKAKFWYGSFTDGDGVKRRVKLSANKAAAQQLLNEHVRRGEMERAGVRDPYRDHRNRPVADHLAEWEAVLRGRGNNGRYVSIKLAQARAVFGACGVVMLADLSASKVETALAEMRKRPRFGTQTSNHHLAAVKQFTRWMVRDRRMADDPFSHLTGGNVRLDRRHERRDLSDAELVRLMNHTRTAGPFRGLSGADREMLYLVGLYTGFRASELASLTPESFALGPARQTVTVEAAYAKNRREDTVPLHPDAVRLVAPWLVGRATGERLWPGKWSAERSQGGKMIKRDLEAARLAWIGEAATPADRAAREVSDFMKDVDAAGLVVDFHSLRHTFVSRLIKAGVKPKEAQTLARHSTITLTMDRYAHTGYDEAAAAVGTVPAIWPATPPAACTPACTELAPNGAGGGRSGTAVDGASPAESPQAGLAEVHDLKGLEGSRRSLTSGEGGNLLTPLFAPHDDYRLITLIRWKNKAFAASHRPGHEPGLRVILGVKTGSVCTKRAPVVHRGIAEMGLSEINVRIPTTHLRKTLLRKLISGDTADVAARLRARPQRLRVPGPEGPWVAGSATRRPRWCRHRLP